MNLDLFLKRCADTNRDDRGLILPIFDKDIIQVLDSFRDENPTLLSDTLRERRRKVQIN